MCLRLCPYTDTACLPCTSLVAKALTSSLRLLLPLVQGVLAGGSWRLDGVARVLPPAVCDVSLYASRTPGAFGQYLRPRLDLRS